VIRVRPTVWIVADIESEFNEAGVGPLLGEGGHDCIVGLWHVAPILPECGAAINSIA
jgi:hypothetical protein